MNGLPVERLKINAFRDGHSRHGRSPYSRRSRVGDGHAFPNTGGSLLLSLPNASKKLHGIFQHASALKRLRQQQKRLALRGGTLIQKNKILPQKIQQLQLCLPLSLNSRSKGAAIP